MRSIFLTGIQIKTESLKRVYAKINSIKINNSCVEMTYENTFD